MKNQMSVEYVGDLRTESVHIDSNTTIITDAPKDNQGLGRKFSPTDLVASSLVSGSIALTGHSGSQTPQSIHSSGFMTSIFSPS